MAYFYGWKEILLHERDTLLSAVTRAVEGQTVRILGSSSEEIESYIREMIREECVYGI